MFITIIFILFVIFMYQSIEIHVKEIDEKPVQERVYLNKKINCDDEAVFVFETKPGLSTDQCIEECKLRKKCSFVNHHKYAQLCYMIAGNGTNDIQLNISSSNGFIYGNKSQWNMKNYENCNICNKTQTCQLRKNKTPRCIFTGCGRPHSIAHTTILGNIFRVGSKLKYKCQDKLLMTKDSHSQIICQENGNWTIAKIQCVDQCKADWTWGGMTSCYFFEQTGMGRDSAQECCQSKGAHLVNISSSGEEDFLKSFFEDSTKIENFEAHIGSSLHGDKKCVGKNNNKWSYKPVCTSPEGYWSCCEYELKNKCG